MGNRYIVDWKKYAETARRAAAEGAVLLRNENQALPLRAGEKISVFGRIQFDYYKSGTGSGGMVNTRYVTGILDALKQEKDLQINEELENVYRDWLKDNPLEIGAGWGAEPWSQKEMPLDPEVVKKAAAASAAAVVVIGRTAGEDRDAAAVPGSYLLSSGEEEMLQAVRSGFQRMIVVLNVGNIIDMNWVEEIKPDAVLYVWQGGQEGGNGVADVLTGRVNPCGKLSDTIARSIEDYPSASAFGGEWGNSYVEDIYVGYRYFETFAREKVLYPFGFGLSYTKFEVRGEYVSHENSSSRIRALVKNVGDCSGKEVVQVYVQAPNGVLGKPSRVLTAFGKTGILAPGESAELNFTVDDYALSSYDDSGITGHKSCYVLEEGSYDFYVGTDVRSAKKTGGFHQEKLSVLETCKEALSPVEGFQRMKAEVSEAGEKKLVWEPVPLRTYSLQDRILTDPVKEIPFTGDQGYRLQDVYDGKVSLEDFTAQLSDEDLCCMVRGEGMCSPKVTPGTAGAFGGVTDSLKGFGIPCGCCSDGPSGIRMDCGTPAFSMPNGTCLACTFNADLVKELFVLTGSELRKNRVDTLLGPGMNIHRNPLNGRNFEYFSEDPLLTGKMASAQLQGMNEYGVTGTIKHFAGNNQEHHRRRYNSVVSERALREIYLKGFEIAVKEGKAYSIMSTYGAVNGLWTGSSYDLLTTILRGEWHYEGMVMTDWWAELNEEGKSQTMTNTAAMVRSQNDVYMVVQNSQANSAGDNLEESLKNGTLKRGALQRSAMNILKVLMRSPAMLREMGRLSQEELDSVKEMDEDDRVDFDMTFYPMKERLELDGKDMDTSKGKNVLVGIESSIIGLYSLSMKVKVEGSRIAQVPFSVFNNGKLMGTITLNGTDGEWIQVDQILGPFVQSHNFVKLYFAQSGIHIDTLVIELKQEFKLPFMRPESVQ